MKLRNIALTTVALLSSIPASNAFAGTYVNNTYINGHETGHRNVHVTNVRTEHGNVHEFSESLKLSTDFPNANGYIKFDGDLSGKLNVSTRNIDPSILGGYSSQSVNYEFTDITKTNLTETVDYFNDIYTHQLNTGTN